MSDIWHAFPTYTQPESAVAHHTPQKELAPLTAAALPAPQGQSDSSHRSVPRLSRRSPRPVPHPASDRLLLRSSHRLLEGRYEIEGAIGKGSMGTVFRARDLQQNTLCAIKMLHKRALQDEADFQRFINEATVIAQLFHPNIVEVREFRRDAKCGPFLVMELLHGIDLHSHLADGRKLPLERVQLVVRQVASALSAAHSLGIVHRDIKPRNIFLAQQCGTTGAMVETVKVVDFGLSKILGGRAQTAPGEILGTPEYLAPEGTWGRSALMDERTDQWALAVTAYRMLTGKLPFCDDDVLRLMLKVRQQPLPLLSAQAVQVPEYVAQALSRALSKKKEDRYPSVLDFARALYGLTAPAKSPPAAVVIASAPAEPDFCPRVPPLTPEQERQIEQLEQTQPLAQIMLDDLLCQSGAAAAPGATPRRRAAGVVRSASGAVANPGGQSSAALDARSADAERPRPPSSTWRLVLTGSIFGVLFTVGMSVGLALVRDRFFEPSRARFSAGASGAAAAEPSAALGAPPPGLGNRLTSSQAVRP